MNTTTENAPRWPEMIVEIHETPAVVAVMANAPGRPGSRLGSRTLICIAIAVLHVGAALLLMLDPADFARQGSAPVPMLVTFIEPESRAALAPVADVIAPAPIELTQPVVPELIDDPHPAMRSLEPPKLDPTGQLELAPYSARAQLAHGQIATVLIVLDIATDGTVQEAQIVRTTGNDAANAAALDYARTTRWIPGNIGGEPRPMKASLTVILGENS